MTTERKAATSGGDLGGPGSVSVGVSTDMNSGTSSGASVNGAGARKANVRLGLILGSIALAFFVGFVIKMVLLSRPA